MTSRALSSDRMVAVLALAVAACATDTPYAPPPVTDPTKLYWSLTLNHRAVTLSTVAPYDTIRLVATPRTIKGLPIAGLPAPTFTSLDLQNVQVSATGLVHVIGTGTQFTVVASLSIGNDTHADTAIFNVTDTTTPPVLSRFTIHPPPGDSAKTASNFPTLIPSAGIDAAGDTIQNLATYYSTADSSVATIDRTGVLSPVRPGHVTVYATATAYGITKADTLPYTIGYSLFAVIQIAAEPNAAGKIVGIFTPSTVSLGPGATVVFQNQSAPSTDVTFDDPTHVMQDDAACAQHVWWCGSGNIAAFANDPSDTSDTKQLRIRSIPAPGTYKFHSTISGASGSVVVMKQ